jgi:ribosomal protein S27E
MTPPRWTLLNKEIKTETFIEGGTLVFGYTIRPVVSADHRFIQLALKVEQKDVTPAVCQTTVVIPDGGTVLLGGFQATREVEKDCPQPALGYIPYVNRLFKVVETSSEPRRGFMLVKARIVGQSQEVEKSGQATAVCPKCQEKGCCLTPVNEPTTGQAKALVELLRAYDAACDEGRVEEADKLARAALILDPTCFHGKR